jgi:hypothetical protein
MRQAIRIPGFSIRQMMIAVAIVALMMGMLRLGIWVFDPTAGPLASHLDAGDEVYLFDEVNVTVEAEANPGRKLKLAAGTPCVVLMDFTSDDDDFYGNYDRIITVEVDAGEHRGTVVTIPRRDLRVKMEWYHLRQRR